MAENRELALVLKLVADQFASGLSSARDSLKTFGTEVAKMAAPLAAVGVAMGGVVVKAANFGEDLKRASKSIGIGVEALAGLRYAAELSETPVEALEKGIAKLAKATVHAADGDAQAAALFEKVGVSAQDADGKVRPMQELLLDIADKFASMTNETERTGLAMDLFGKSGAALIPLFSEGATKIRAMIEEARQLGIVISNEDAEAADEFNDNLTRLHKMLLGLTVQLGTQFIPALNQIAEAIKPVVIAISEWAHAHPELMQGLVAMAGILGAGGAVAVAVAAFGALLAGLAVVGGPILLVSAGIAAFVGVLVAFRKEIASAIESVRRFVNDGLAAADRFISTMVEGLEKKIAPIAKVAESIAGAVAKFLKPGSPTEEGPWSDLDQWGERFGETLAEGMERGAPAVADAAEGIATDAKAKFKQESANRRIANELDLRGTIPTREGGRFTGAVERTGTTFTEGMEEGFKKFTERAEDSFALGVQLADAAAQAMANAFEKFFFNVLEGKIRSLKDVFSALQDLTKAFVDAIIKELIRIAAVKTVGLVFGLFGIDGGPKVKANTGGQIVRRYGVGGTVAGVGSTDTVPAMLTPGEYVLSRTGVEALDRLNAGQIPLIPVGGSAPPAVENKVDIIINNFGSAPVESTQSGGRWRDGRQQIYVTIRDVMKKAFSEGDMDRVLENRFMMRPRPTMR